MDFSFRFQYIDHHHFNDSGRGHKYVYCLIGFDFRTPTMIGLFKSLGAGNLIQKIFLYNGVSIMSKGLFWGNLIGILFYLTQKHLGWIRLDPETYYVDIAPVSMNFWDVLLLNFGFLVVSSLLLWIPSTIISNIILPVFYDFVSLFPY